MTTFEAKSVDLTSNADGTVSISINFSLPTIAVDTSPEKLAEAKAEEPNVKPEQQVLKVGDTRTLSHSGDAISLSTAGVVQVNGVDNPDWQGQELILDSTGQLCLKGMSGTWYLIDRATYTVHPFPTAVID